LQSTGTDQQGRLIFNSRGIFAGSGRLDMQKTDSNEVRVTSPTCCWRVSPLPRTVQPSNWKDEATGEWKNSFSIVAWAVEIHGDKISFQRKQAQQQDIQGLHQKYEIPTAQAGDPF
jgi:hypothetical protein